MLHPFSRLQRAAPLRTVYPSLGLAHPFSFRPLYRDPHHPAIHRSAGAIPCRLAHAGLRGACLQVQHIISFGDINF